MESWVSTRAFPRAGITFCSALRAPQIRAPPIKEDRDAPVEIVACREGRPARREARLFGVPLDEEPRDGGELGLVFGIWGHLALLLLGLFELGHMSARQVRWLSLEKAGAERRLG